MRILLVEDNDRMLSTLMQGLSEEGFEPHGVSSGAEALARALKADIDAIVLDLGLPDMDGMEILAEVRKRKLHVPVLVLTARDAVESRVDALDAGADDYLIKPFSFAELVARLRALSRRAVGPRWTNVSYGGISIDDDLSVRCGDARVMLSPREHGLLSYLLRRRGDVVPRGDILREVFALHFDPGTNLIDVHLNHLRKKIASMPVVIETIRGAGLRLELKA